MLITHQVKQGTDEWHALRLQYPHTASLAGVLLAKGKNAASNTQGSHGSGFWAQRGHILEDEAIEVYEAVYGVKVERPGFITNDKYPDAGYSPDAMLPTVAIEVKCFAEARHLECLKITPLEVYAQVQFGLMIAELDMAHLVHYNPDIADSKLCFRVIEVPRDEKLIERFKLKLYGGMV
jgi:hypothetical protein